MKLGRPWPARHFSLFLLLPSRDFSPSASSLLPEARNERMFTPCNISNMAKLQQSFPRGTYPRMIRTVSVSESSAPTTALCQRVLFSHGRAFFLDGRKGQCSSLCTFSLVAFCCGGGSGERLPPRHLRVISVNLHTLRAFSGLSSFKHPLSGHPRSWMVCFIREFTPRLPQDGCLSQLISSEAV